jgi:hypothetical protein
MFSFNQYIAGNKSRLILYKFTLYKEFCIIIPKTGRGKRNSNFPGISRICEIEKD